ncbi:MAG: helix-turn-helix transcriptional regulator [Magnetospirillum sp.]|nr:helix-turn-helix transcriptional regulator [Magnetospirillum sp.]
MNTADKVQFIEQDGERRFAVLPIADWELILDRLDELEAVRAFDAGVVGETFPEEVVHRLVAGENPLRVFREYRGLSLRGLAECAGLSAAYLSDIETGKRDGTIETMKKIAAALGLDLDDIV